VAIQREENIKHWPRAWKSTWSGTMDRRVKPGGDEGRDDIEVKRRKERTEAQNHQKHSFVIARPRRRRVTRQSMRRFRVCSYHEAHARRRLRIGLHFHLAKKALGAASVIYFDSNYMLLDAFDGLIPTNK
jgi:hypothetical protein